MPDTFEKRGKGFEAKFAHDEELAFKARVRRAKLAGQWAADLMGLNGEDGKAYVKDVIGAEIDGGEDRLLAKINSDLASKHVDRSEHQIARELEEKIAVAREQVMKEAES